VRQDVNRKVVDLVSLYNFTKGVWIYSDPFVLKMHAMMAEF
jgi:hypothetical protein